MDNAFDYLEPEWANLICALAKSGKSVAIGVFSPEGRMLGANPAMCYFLDTDIALYHPKNQFINPEFLSFQEHESDNLIFEGLMTIGNSFDVSYALNAKVFRKDKQILIYAEADVPTLFDDNKKMSVLNQEVNNLQRQLIKEKLNLQKALAELKETQQMLVHSEKMNAMGKLVAGVAHELNNPISFVYSNIFSLENYITEVFQSYREVEDLVIKNGDNELIEAVAIIRKKNDLDFLHGDILDMVKESKIGIERVKTIVEDLRKFSRLDESEIKLVDLNDNIHSTITIVRSEITRKNINFSQSVEGNFRVECFPGQLNQALLNVLLNAVDAVDKGGNISLTVTGDDQNFRIAIKDDGYGIPAGYLHRIFDPFFTTKPVGSGTGLGLSITYKIIHDLHHGSIEVESEPGKGTSFKLIIPKKQ